jgi:hypothetical protein
MRTSISNMINGSETTYLCKYGDVTPNLSILPTLNLFFMPPLPILLLRRLYPSKRKDSHIHINVNHILCYLIHMEMISN